MLDEMTAETSAKWGVVSDNGLCLTLGFLYEPTLKGFTVQRLCDQHSVPDPKKKVRRLEENEWPTCARCREIYKQMRDDGVR